MLHFQTGSSSSFNLEHSSLSCSWITTSFSKRHCFRATHRADAAAARQRDSPEEQQPAGDHRGVRGCRHRRRRGHRGSHLHAPVLRPAEEVSPDRFSPLALEILVIRLLRDSTRLK